MLLCSSYVVVSCLLTLMTWRQHKVFFRVFVTWRYVAKHGGHLLEQCSLEQKADFYRHLNRIVILPSGLLACVFDFTYPSPHNPHFPPLLPPMAPQLNSCILAHATAILKTYSVPTENAQETLESRPSTHSTAWKYNRNCILISLWPCKVKSHCSGPGWMTHRNFKILLIPSSTLDRPPLPVHYNGLYKLRVHG